MDAGGQMKKRKARADAEEIAEETTKHLQHKFHWEAGWRKTKMKIFHCCPKCHWAYMCTWHELTAGVSTVSIFETFLLKVSVAQCNQICSENSTQIWFLKKPLFLWPKAAKINICENEPVPSNASDQEESHSNLWRESDVQPGGMCLTVMLGLTLSSFTLFVWTSRSKRASFHNVVMVTVWNWKCSLVVKNHPCFFFFSGVFFFSFSIFHSHPPTPAAPLPNLPVHLLSDVFRFKAF